MYNEGQMSHLDNFETWWFVGFWCALGARFFLENEPNRKGSPITWGGVLLCALFGVLGPFVGILTIVWGLAYFCDWLGATDALGGFFKSFKRPVFGPKDK